MAVVANSSPWKELFRAWPLWLMAMALDVRADTAEAPPASALAWLTEMRHAVAGLSYRGVVAYLKDKQVESFQLFHAAKSDSGVERERLVSMNSPLREVVRNAERVACYFPDTRTVFVESKPSSHSILLDVPDDLARLSRYYRVGLQGQEYVARRLSQVVDVEPRDNYRYGRRIWVDVDSKLPLKFETRAEDGRLVEQLVFTALDIESTIPERELESSIQTDSFQWQVSRRESLPLDSLRWTLHGVPEGFQIISYTRLKRPPNDRAVEHILLSDGFSSVSIYIEGRKEGTLREHPKKLGAIHAHSLMLGDFRITVMGEVPEKTVLAIAQGLHF
ncbi:MucB/RseB C-terminal domain-containing protein [Candidatus Methylocalor cossyra]|uniref:Sigma factor RpoE negative regulatory protein RseB n=1 Tax=Candidatus Methylocalor cossyra TaxID=3108543 RepID=A0ABM9NFK9_9GAMM